METEKKTWKSNPNDSPQHRWNVIKQSKRHRNPPGKNAVKKVETLVPKLKPIKSKNHKNTVTPSNSHPHPPHHSHPIPSPLLSPPLVQPNAAPYYSTELNSSCSKINFPSLYFSLGSQAKSYFHPTTSWHVLHIMSRTTCLPVVICRWSGSPSSQFTTLEKR